MTFVHLSGNFSAHKLNIKRHTAAANSHHKEMKQHYGSVAKGRERGRMFVYLHVCKKLTVVKAQQLTVCSHLTAQF